MSELTFCSEEALEELVSERYQMIFRGLEQNITSVSLIMSVNRAYQPLTGMVMKLAIETEAPLKSLNSFLTIDKEPSQSKVIISSLNRQIISS